MATEAVVPDHCADEQIEKKVTEETKVVELEGVSPSKEKGETDEEQKPKAEELATPIACVAEMEEKMEDKQIDLSASVEVQKDEKVDDALGLDMLAEVAPKVAEAPDSKLDVSSVSEPGEEVIEKEPEEQSKISSVPELAVEERMEHLQVLPTQEPVPEVGNKPKEASESESKIIEEPESVILEEPEVISQSDSKVVEKSESAVEELELGKEPEAVSQSDSKVVEKPESAVEVEDKPQEKSDVIEDVEKISEMPKPKASEKDELAKIDDILVAKLKDVTESLEVEQTGKGQEPLVCESSDTVVSTNQESQDGGVSVLPDVVEKDEKKEGGSGVLEVEKVEEENVKVEELAQPETSKTDSNIATEVAERTCEGVEFTKEKKEVNVKDDITASLVETTQDRDIQGCTEEKKEENVKDDITVSVETTKDSDIEGKVDMNTTEVVKELELEAKAKDAIEAVVDKLDKATELDEEAAKYHDAPNLESSKDVDHSKTEGDPSKQDVPTKSTQKHSNNIISKVKQSIVKVKKAIIGKSPSSKILTSDAKDDIKVK